MKFYIHWFWFMKKFSERAMNEEAMESDDKGERAEKDRRDGEGVGKEEDSETESVSAAQSSPNLSRPLPQPPSFLTSHLPTSPSSSSSFRSTSSSSPSRHLSPFHSTPSPSVSSLTPTLSSPNISSSPKNEPYNKLVAIEGDECVCHTKLGFPVRKSHEKEYSEFIQQVDMLEKIRSECYAHIVEKKGKWSFVAKEEVLWREKV